MIWKNDLKNLIITIDEFDSEDELFLKWVFRENFERLKHN
jgi:hypothetical protein